MDLVVSPNPQPQFYVQYNLQVIGNFFVSSKNQMSKVLNGDFSFFVCPGMIVAQKRPSHFPT